MKLSFEDLLEEAEGQGLSSGLACWRRLFLMCMLGRNELERYSVFGSGMFLVKNAEEVLLGSH